MKILVLTYEIFPQPGGIQKYIHTFSKALGEIFGKESVNVVPFYGRYEKSTDYNILFLIAHFPKYLKRFAYLPLLIYIARKVKPEIVILNHITFSKYHWLLRKLRLSYAAVVYGIEVWGDLKKEELEFLNDSAFIISISEFTKRVLVGKGISPEKVKVLYIGINTKKFRMISREKNELKIDSNYTLLTTARLESSERYKGYDKVIELLPEMNRELPGVKYIIIGDGSDKERIVILAEALGVKDRIIFPGQITDLDLLIGYYNLCDLFIMPSNFYIEKNRVAGEGFGFVYLEAAACGKPVIAGKGGGCPEAIEDGVTGFLVDPNDKKGLYETIVKLLRDKELAKKMGAAGRKRVEENFSYEVFLKKVKEIFL
jgi:phosphatidylinositol alpha-1,6-mannosyltransferase